MNIKPITLLSKFSENELFPSLTLNKIQIANFQNTEIRKAINKIIISKPVSKKNITHECIKKNEYVYLNSKRKISPRVLEMILEAPTKKSEPENIKNQSYSIKKNTGKIAKKANLSGLKSKEILYSNLNSSSKHTRLKLNIRRTKKIEKNKIMQWESQSFQEYLHKLYKHASNTLISKLKWYVTCDDER